MYSFCSYEKQEPAIPKSEFTCGQCWLDGKEVTYCNACPGSPDYKCSKGMGLRKYSNFFTVKSKKVKVSDLEDSSMERILHEARRILGETGYTEDSWSMTMNIKDIKYNIGYRWVDNQVEVSIDLPDCNFSARSYDGTICRLRKYTTGSRLHGLLINESIVRFPNHIFNDDNDDVRLTFKGKEYPLLTLVKFTSNDVRYAMITNGDGTVEKISGNKSLVKHFVPVSELSKITRVRIHDPEGNITVETQYKYHLKLPQAYHDGDT